MPGTVLGPGGAAGNTPDKTTVLMELTLSRERQKINKINKYFIRSG